MDSAWDRSAYTVALPRCLPKKGINGPAMAFLRKEPRKRMGVPPRFLGCGKFRGWLKSARPAKPDERGRCYRKNYLLGLLMVILAIL